jgi:AbrB family looped-hinge helix DNA binding protein
MGKREIRVQVGTSGEVMIPKSLRNAIRLAPGSEVTLSSEGDRIVIRAVRNDVPGTFERIARSGPSVRTFPPHEAYESELRSRRP